MNYKQKRAARVEKQFGANTVMKLQYASVNMLDVLIMHKIMSMLFSFIVGHKELFIALFRLQL
jgi:hypothetical protein